MSAIDDVLAERWGVEMGDLMTVYDLTREWNDPDVQVCVCDHSIVKDKLERTQARAAVASQAPEMARLLAAIIEEYVGHVAPLPFGLALAIENAREFLAAVREAAGE